MSDEYIKPINKTTLTVEFVIGDFRQKMELPRAPQIGELFHDPTQQKKAKIIEVIFQPWNPDFADVLAIGTYI